MRRIVKTWGEFFNVLRHHPAIILPFLLTALCNALALYLVYLYPQRPVSLLLAPPVKAFYGERFLHYPLNLVLLPRLFYYAQIIVSFSIGVILVALAVKLISRAWYEQKNPVLIDVITIVRRYFVLLIAWCLPFFLGVGVFRLFSRLTPQFQSVHPALFAMLGFLLTICAQVAFIYLVPAILISGKRIFPALKQNFSMLARFFPQTTVLVLAPALLYLPVLVLKTKSIYLMTQIFPEIVMLIHVSGIVVMFFIDLCVVGATTILYMEECGK